MSHAIIRPYPESLGRGLSSCQAVRAGNQVFMMGQVSWDLEGNTVPGDASAQANPGHAEYQDGAGGGRVEAGAHRQDNALTDGLASPRTRVRRHG